MTPEQKVICTNLGKVSYPMGTFDKRFGRQLSTLAESIDYELSEKQIEWMFRLLYKYRKQLPKTYSLYGHTSPFCAPLKT